MANICLLIVPGLFAAAILAEVLQSRRITADTIYGVLCVYLLIGFAWGIL